MIRLQTWDLIEIGYASSNDGVLLIQTKIDSPEFRSHQLPYASILLQLTRLLYYWLLHLVHQHILHSSIPCNTSLSLQKNTMLPVLRQVTAIHGSNCWNLRITWEIFQGIILVGWFLHNFLETAGFSRLTFLCTVIIANSTESIVLSSRIPARIQCVTNLGDHLRWILHDWISSSEFHIFLLCARRLHLHTLWWNLIVNCSWFLSCEAGSGVLRLQEVIRKYFLILGFPLLHVRIGWLLANDFCQWNLRHLPWNWHWWSYDHWLLHLIYLQTFKLLISLWIEVSTTGPPLICIRIWRNRLGRELWRLTFTKTRDPEHLRAFKDVLFMVGSSAQPPLLTLGIPGAYFITLFSVSDYTLAFCLWALRLFKIWDIFGRCWYVQLTGNLLLGVAWLLFLDWFFGCFLNLDALLFLRMRWTTGCCLSLGWHSVYLIFCGYFWLHLALDSRGRNLLLSCWGGLLLQRNRLTALRLSLAILLTPGSCTLGSAPLTSCGLDSPLAPSSLHQLFPRFQI